MDIIKAHEYSSYNYEALKNDTVCGCFYCGEIFNSADINDWTPEPDGSKTALCPYCGIDSVIGEGSGYPITEDVDSFLLGYTSAKDMTDGEYVDRKIVRVPNTDDIVIVYDRNQEDEYVNVEFPEMYKRHAAEYKEHTGKEFTMQVS